MELTLQVVHMNYGNHLGNDSVLTLAHEARVCWLRSLGHCELNIDGVGLIQSDAMVMYKSEGLLGDQVEINLYLGEKSSKTMDIYCKLTNKESNKEIARVKVGLVFFNYDQKSISNIPTNFLEYLNDV
jgi:4-hydroxybenzoyl-CoA thioesterase